MPRYVCPGGSRSLRGLFLSSHASDLKKTMNSRLTTPASGVLARADQLADWSAMAKGAFSANTVRVASGLGNIRGVLSGVSSEGVADPTTSEDVKLALKEMGETRQQGRSRRGVWCGRRLRSFSQLRKKLSNKRDTPGSAGASHSTTHRKR